MLSAELITLLCQCLKLFLLVLHLVLLLFIRNNTEIFSEAVYDLQNFFHL